LKDPKIFVLRPFGHLRFGFHPQAQFVQVIQANATVEHPFLQGDRGGRSEAATRSRSAALFSENESGHFVAQLPYFVGIRRCPEALGKRKKAFSFSLLCF
jgi:hypothetical protein